MESGEFLEGGSVLARERSHRRWRRGTGGRGRRTAHPALSAVIPAAIAVLVLSCGDDAVEPTPADPAVTAAFVEDSVRVAEGETRVVGIRYRIEQGALPLAILVSVVHGDAGAEDYELSETRFEIPAGSLPEGTFDLAVAGQADDAFAEGDERLLLQLTVLSESPADVGPSLPVAILDAPVSPVPGVSLAATPPERIEAARGLSYTLADARLRTTLTSEWHPDSEGVSMRWIGPYGERREWIDVEHHPYNRYAERAQPRPPQPAFHIEAWRLASRHSAVTHEIDVSWPVGSALQLTFGGDVGVACAADGCWMPDEARSAGSATSQKPRASIPSPAVAPPSLDVVPYRWDTQWTFDGHVRSLAAANSYLLGNYGWHPSVWPAGDTLVFYLSSANWPENARMTPEEVKDLLNKMLAEWTDIPTADILWRVDGPVDLEPGRDGKNIFFVDPGSAHGARTGGSWRDEIDGVRGVVEADHSLGTPQESVLFPRSVYDTPWAYVANEMGMHPLGHTLGLDHAAAFPVARSCPPPTYGVDNCGPVNGDSRYWRRVSGAWPVDPIMSYGVSSIMSWTADGRTLRLDDEVGASLLRPKPGWLATTGTIAGSVRTDDGRPVPHIHVWAVQPNADGVMDGVGAFADGNGDFQIRGLPPGDWILVAHPDLDWLANPWFFYEGQGDLLDEMLLFPMRAEAGQETGGIEIVMAHGRTGAP